MIKEIIEFMDANQNIENFFIQNEVSASYLHYYIKIQEDMVCNDLLDIDNLDSELKETLKYMTYYQKGMHNKYLDKNKGLGGSSPYILTVKVLYNKADETESIKTSINNLKPTKNGILSNRIKVQIQSAIAYLDDEDDKEKLLFIQKYLDENLEKSLLSKKSIIDELREKYNNQKKNKKEVSVEIRVYIDVGLERVKAFYEKFVEKRAFLSIDKAGLHKGNCSLCEKYSDELSLPYVLSTLGDTLGMKATMPLKLTNHVCKICTLKLHKFKVMTDNQQLTKPFPLFIDNKSLFGKQQKILKDNEKKKSYREIIKSIYYTNPKDLKNFYLLNYVSKSDNGWKLQIKDLDYIENFQYMTTFEIENCLEMKVSLHLGDFYDRKLSVFQFEKIINELLFEKKLQYNYFSDYKDLKITYWKIDSGNANSILKNYLLKYRQNFYDFIYKSHQSALGLIDFREMLLDIIIDNIRHDDKNKEGYSIYENEIKEKLNLLFSLNQKKEMKVDRGEFKGLKNRMTGLGYFQNLKDNNGKIILREDEKPKVEFVQGLNSIEYNKSNDRFFAFLCGQFARFLLNSSQSKDENKTHKRFSGFTEWQNSGLLKEYIFQNFARYSHKLQNRKYNGIYENSMSIIMSYRNDLDMKSVMEYLISGYFADNYFYEKTKKLNEEN